MKKLVVYTAAMVGVFLLVLSACSDDAAIPTTGGNGGDYDSTLIFLLWEFGTQFRGICGYDGEGYVAVGEEGVVVVGGFDRGAIYWTAISTGVSNNLNSVWGPALSDMYAVGDKGPSAAGVILHYDGRSITSMTHPFEDDITGIDGATSAGIWAVGRDGRVARLDGSSWRQQFIHPGGQPFNDVWVFESGLVVAVGDDGEAYGLAGTAWTKIPAAGAPDFQSVHGTMGGAAYAVGGDEVWELSGSELVRVYDGAAGELQAIHASAQDNVWAVGTNNVVLYYNGSGWSEMTAGGSDHMRAVWVHAPDEIAAVGDFGGWYSHRGAGWQVYNHSDRSTWNDFDDEFSTGGKVRCGAKGDSLKWEEDLYWRGVGPLRDGAELVALTFATYDNLYVLSTVYGVDSYVDQYTGGYWIQGWYIGSSTTEPRDIYYSGDRLFVPCYDGSIYSWEVTGNPQEVHQVDPWQPLYAVWGSSYNDVFVVGGDGTVAYKDRDGWRSLDSGTTADLYAVWGKPFVSGPGGPGPEYGVWAVGEDGTAIRARFNNWTAIHTGVTEDLYGVWGYDASHVWAAGENGTVVLYDNDRWTRVYTGLDPVDLTSVLVTAKYGVWVGGEDGYLLYGLKVAAE